MQYAPKGHPRERAILPGLIRTPMAVDDVVRASASTATSWCTRATALCRCSAWARRGTSRGRRSISRPDESRYVTGVLLPVDGGLTCNLTRRPDVVSRSSKRRPAPGTSSWPAERHGHDDDQRTGRTAKESVPRLRRHGERQLRPRSALRTVVQAEAALLRPHLSRIDGGLVADHATSAAVAQAAQRRLELRTVAERARRLEAR